MADKRNPDGHSPRYWRSHPKTVRPKIEDSSEGGTSKFASSDRKWEWAHTLGCLGIAVGIGGLLFPLGTPDAFISWLVVLFFFLVYPFLHFSRIVLPFAKPKLAYTASMAVLIGSIAVVGIKNFPKPAYYHSLSQKERTRFIDALKSQKTERQIVRVSCPNNNEDLCVIAKDYVELLQWGDWKVEGPAVQRTSLAKPMAGIVLMSHSTGIGTPDDPRTGVWVKQTDSNRTIVAAFKTLDTKLTEQGDYTMPENTIALYFGPAPH